MGKVKEYLYEVQEGREQPFTSLEYEDVFTSTVLGMQPVTAAGSRAQAHFMAETAQILPTGEPAFVCADCNKPTPELERSALKSRAICNDCYIDRFKLTIA